MIIIDDSYARENTSAIQRREKNVSKNEVRASLLGSLHW